MLPQVVVGRHCCAQSTNPDNYQPLVRDDLIDELQDLARSVAAVHICQINATSAGGGVAELLSGMIPVPEGIGVHAEWRLIHGDAPFFEITKAFHNALQGANLDLSETIKQTYLDRNRACAEMIEGSYDVYIVHDPQPVALKHFVTANNGRWIWRCHIDSSEPNPHVWSFMKPFIEEYDSVVFPTDEFCPPDLKASRVVFIPPAIDPLSTKNMELPEEICKRTLANSGVDLNRPPMQFPKDYDDFLVSDVEECAKQALRLLEDTEKRKAFGKAGQEKVRKEFLLPRLIRDELKLVKEVLSL